jgi:hypothetical protein
VFFGDFGERVAADHRVLRALGGGSSGRLVGVAKEVSVSILIRLNGWLYGFFFALIAYEIEQSHGRRLGEKEKTADNACA